MSLESFTVAYIKCLLWSETDGENPLDDNYGEYDISPELMTEIKEDCGDFYQHRELWDEWTDEEAGHDFCLTRNRHGAGFWDRNRTNGDKLTQLSHEYGSMEVYPSEGKLYS